MCWPVKSVPMCRYTALRTSLILAAVLRPVLALAFKPSDLYPNLKRY